MSTTTRKGSPAKAVFWLMMSVICIIFLVIAVNNFMHSQDKFNKDMANWVDDCEALNDEIRQHNRESPGYTVRLTNCNP
jgi:hypothetical protein